MMHDYWRTVADLAGVWRSAATVRAVVEPLSDTTTASPALVDLLADARVAHGTARPLRLASTVEYHRLNVTGGSPRTAEYDAWLRRAAIVEEAFRLQVSWVRSRLPGFPMLRAPHLVDGTVFTTTEFTDELTWPKQHYLLRFQERPSPPSADLDGEELDLSEPTHRFLDELQQTDPWIDFARASAQLSDDDRAQLRQVNEQLRAALRETLDPSIRSDVTRVNAFRRAQLSSAVERLSGAARTYTDAFSALNGFLDFTLDDVLAALVVSEPVRHVSPVGELDLSGAGTVSFASASPLSTGDLVALPGVVEIVRVNEARIAADGGVLSLPYHATIIDGIASTVRR